MASASSEYVKRMFDTVRLQLLGARDITILAHRNDRTTVHQAFKLSVVTRRHSKTSYRALLNMPVTVASLIKKHEDEKDGGDLAEYLSEGIAAVVRETCKKFTVNHWKNLVAEDVPVYAKQEGKVTTVYLVLAKFVFSPGIAGAPDRTCAVVLGVQCGFDLSINSELICVDEADFKLVDAGDGGFVALKNLHREFCFKSGRPGIFGKFKGYVEKQFVCHPGVKINGAFTRGLAQECLRVMQDNVGLSDIVAYHHCIKTDDELLPVFDETLTRALKRIVGVLGIEYFCNKIYFYERRLGYCSAAHVLFKACCGDGRQDPVSVCEDILALLNLAAGRSWSESTSSRFRVVSAAAKVTRCEQHALPEKSDESDWESSPVFDVAVCAFVSLHFPHPGLGGFKRVVARVLDERRNPLRMHLGDRAPLEVPTKLAMLPEVDEPEYIPDLSHGGDRKRARI